MSQDSRKQPHFFLGATGVTERFTSPSSPINKPPIPQPDRQSHGEKLRGDLAVIKSVQKELKDTVNTDDLNGPVGIQIEFQSLPNIELPFSSLSSERSNDGAKNIEVLNVIQLEDKTIATVFVPDGKIEVFEKKINAYLENKTNRSGNPADNRALINTISSIRTAELEALWTDSPEVFPEDENAILWWEIWLPIRGNRQSIIDDFTHLAGQSGMTVSSAIVKFPERSVLLAKGSKKQLLSSPLILNSIAELRLAKETADFFDNLEITEQRDWATELLSRTTFDEHSNVRVCILDTGITSGHPLLSPVIDDDDCHSVEPDWDTADAHGHGTEMAGLAIWGDLTNALESTTTRNIRHRLESVKLLRSNGDNSDKHLGEITSQGASLPIIDNPHYKRVYSMAVTANDNRDRGRPSAWSASMDNLAVDYTGDGESPHLFIISAGNVTRDLQDINIYPELNLIEDVHDPAQAWNVLTAGAYTEKVTILEDAPDYKAMAPSGGLSPFSSTSVSWYDHAPIKPELVLEGGNLAVDDSVAVDMQSLSLLTVHRNITDRLFTTTRATSAATALLAKMSADVMVEFPEIWPETVRALLVHSAQWTETLKAQFNHGNTERQKHNYLLRCCGYGVPSLSRALRSANNSLTMIIEDSLQPFVKEKGGIKTHDMHIHELPWPKDMLLDLGETPVTMTVTLSYFIEPNPSARGVKGRYNYQSHNLRFDVKRPLESQDQFKARINTAARTPEENGTAGAKDSNWLIGSSRNKGSLHKDIWNGTAADLAERGNIAIYPAMGWWRTRPKLGRFGRKARYSLVVTIETPEVTTDIYSAVQAEIAVPIAITT